MLFFCYCTLQSCSNTRAVTTAMQSSPLSFVFLILGQKGLHMSKLSRSDNHTKQTTKTKASSLFWTRFWEGSRTSQSTRLGQCRLTIFRNSPFQRVPEVASCRPELCRTWLKPAQRKSKSITAQTVKLFITASCWWQFFFFCKLLSVILQFDGGEQYKKWQRKLGSSHTEGQAKKKKRNLLINEIYRRGMLQETRHWEENRAFQEYSQGAPQNTRNPVPQYLNIVPNSFRWRKGTTLSPKYLTTVPSILLYVFWYFVNQCFRITHTCQCHLYQRFGSGMTLFKLSSSVTLSWRWLSERMNRRARTPILYECNYGPFMSKMMQLESGWENYSAFMQ